MTMDAADIFFVYVTCPSENVAAHIAKAMIEQRRAACANILPAGRSFFRWDGKMEEADEVTIIFKTVKDAWAGLRDAVVAMHPYDTPCVVALPVADGHAPFLQWVREEVAGAGSIPV